MFEGSDTKLIRKFRINGKVYFCQRLIVYISKNYQRKITYEVRKKTGIFTSKLLAEYSDETDAVNYLDNLIQELQ